MAKNETSGLWRTLRRRGPLLISLGGVLTVLALVVSDHVSNCAAYGARCGAAQELIAGEDRAEPPPPPVAPTRLVSVAVEPFEITSARDRELGALRALLEQAVIERFWSQNLAVAHPLTTPGGATAPKRTVSATLSRGRGARDQVTFTATLKQGDETLGEARITAPLSTFRENPAALAAAVFAVQGEREYAEPVLRAGATGSSPFAWWMFEEARRRSAARDLDGAVRFLDRALAADRTFAPALWAKGDLLNQAGDLRGKLAMQQAIVMDPDAPRISLRPDHAENPTQPALRLASTQTQWRELEPGLDVLDVRAPEIVGGITAWRIDPLYFEITAEAALLPDGEPVRDMRLREGAVVAVAARGALPTVAPDGVGQAASPAGLLVSNGERRRALDREAGDALFVIDLDGPWVTPANVQPRSLVLNAVQGGPLLVGPLATRLAAPADVQRYPQSAVCATPRGRVVLVVADAALSRAELSAWLEQPEARGGFGCEGAMALTTGSATQASASHVNGSREIEGLWRAHDAILVKPRRRAL